MFLSKLVFEQLVYFEKHPGVSGIILRVNSPGGVVAPSQEIYEEVLHDCLLKLKFFVAPAFTDAEA